MLSPLTFCGALEEFYKSIAKGWNNETREKYDRDFNNVILPHIEHHNREKIISAYTKEDCEENIKRHTEDGYLSRGPEKEYSRDTDESFPTSDLLGIPQCSDGRVLSGLLMGNLSLKNQHGTGRIGNPFQNPD